MGTRGIDVSRRVHVRRGDLQYTAVKIPAADILKNSEGHLEDGELLYIVTDERKREFFAPFDTKYRLKFLSDFEPLLKRYNLGKAVAEKRARVCTSRRRRCSRLSTHTIRAPRGPGKNYYGMVDQIVAASGRTMTGTFFSTFTGYIMRMRGYMGKPNNSSYYFAPDDKVSEGARKRSFR